MNPISFFKHWKQDLPASVVVFLVAVPLCLGISLASGAPPITGLIAGIIGGIVVGGASGSHLGVSGPAAGLAIIVAGAIGLLGLPSFLVALVLAGAMQLVLGLFGAGIIAYYFPNSVIKGMLSGIGIIIILKQIPHAFGYDKDYEGDLGFVQPDNQTTFSELSYALGAITPGALLVAAVCLGILVLWETNWIKGTKALAQIPGPLLAVIAGIVLGSMQSIMGQHGLEAEHYVDLPDLSTGLAAFQFPEWTAISDVRVWTTALTLAIVASLETLLCVEATDKLDSQKRITPTNRELKAQGLGNIFSGMVGGLPITQVIVRSSANIQSGGRTKLSAILHGVWILLALLLIPQLMEMIPLASLAAILLMVGYKLAKPVLFKQMWSKGWTQFTPFIITILGVVFTDLLTGVLLGMGVGILIVLRNNYLTPFHFDGDLADSKHPIRIELSEEVTFFNKASIQRTLAELPNGTHVVIDGHRTVNLDPDVMEIIEECMVRRKEEGVRMDLVGFEKRTAKQGKELPSVVADAAQRKLDRN